MTDPITSQLQKAWDKVDGLPKVTFSDTEAMDLLENLPAGILDNIDSVSISSPADKPVATWPADSSSVIDCDPVACMSIMISSGANEAPYKDLNSGETPNQAEVEFWDRVSKEARRISSWAAQGMSVTKKAIAVHSSPNNENPADDENTIGVADLRTIHRQGYGLGLQHGMNQGLRAAEKLAKANKYDNENNRKLRTPKSVYHASVFTTDPIIKVIVEKLKKVTGVA